MAIKVLVGGWSPEDTAVLKDFSETQKAENFIIVTAEDSDAIVGDLVTAGKSDNGELLSEKLILFYGMTNKQISKFIDGFKKLKLSAPLFAMVTPHSVKWKLSYLLEHLMEEREQMRQQQQKK